jgi:hypothetical protein
MRVFCPEHKRGFFAPRQSPIKCENKGHILGELNFDGEAKAPVELQWQYCCNCEHFCPIDVEQDGLERCPVCTRRSSMLYLCDRCYTISFESNTPLQIKNFTLTSDGAPQPSCPGCLQATSADLREHTCDRLGACFSTALNSCPICGERLDLAPSFPSSVAHYLKRIKAANKLNVTFDYETELFVPVEDGEFVLISNGNEAAQSIVLPRSERLATKRDFYDFYQDYYHCAKPGAGEVHIIQPSSVIPTAAGWKLQATGILEVLEDQPKKKASPAPTRRPVDTLAGEESEPSIAASKKVSTVTPCAHCGSLIETRYAFCWKCGNSLTPKNESSVTHLERPKPSSPPAAIVTDEEDITLQHDVHPAGPPMFSWAMAKEPEGVKSAKGSILKLIAVVAVGLALVSLGLFVLTRSASRIALVTAAQPVTPNVQSDSNLSLGRAIKRDVALEPTPQRASAALSEDDELKTLRARRIAATASDRSAMLQAFARAERQYPNDYRFPYERAKLAIKGPQSRSHDEAFDALSLAAGKAINSGKAKEMLVGLEADKAGDFHKLSHGHHEWNQLEEALKSMDTSLLSGR